MSNHSDSEREEPPRDVESIEEVRRGTNPPPIVRRSRFEKIRSAMLPYQRRASSPELFVRREEQITRRSNVAVEIDGRRGEKRSANSENKLLPSKVNKTDDMIPTISKKVNAVMTTSTQLPQQPDVTHEEMVKNFMQESRMNRKYSQKCLERNGWDYEKAGKNFRKLLEKGSIPAEAFQK